LRRSSATLAPGLTLLAVAGVICIAADVSVRDLALFVGYELAFVVGPGCALAWLLLGRRPALEIAVIGWALGYALEIIFFIAAAALGIRGLFPIYPVLALAVTGGLLLSRRPGIVPLRVPPREAWIVAGAGVLALLFVVGGLVAVSPLPSAAAGVSYYADLPWHMTIIAEAKHHWPLTDGSVSGVRFWYHVWSHLDMAAVSNVTGIEPVVLLLRLFPLSLSILVVLELGLVGRRLGGRPWTGAATAVLAVAVGELDSQAGYSYPFLGLFGLGWWESPSFLLGLAFFLPALLLVCELIRDEVPFRAAWPRWLLVALLLLGADGAKATTVPVLAGGLAVYLLFRLATIRRLERAALTGFLVASGVFVLFYVAVYRHAALAGFTLDPLQTLYRMPQLAAWRGDFASVPGPVYWAVAAVLAPVATYGALAALPALLFQGRRRLDSTQLVLGFMLLVSLVPYFFGSQAGASELFFTHYGFAAGCVLGAAALVALGEGAVRERPGALRATALFGAAWLVALLLLELSGLPWFSTASPALKAGVPGAAVLCVAALLLARRRLPGAEAGTPVAVGITVALSCVLALWKANVIAYWNAPYLLLAIVSVGLALLAFATPRARRASVWLMLVLSVLLFGLLDQPLDYVPNRVLGLPGDRFIGFGGTGESAMSGRLYSGLLWLRAHSTPDDVIAVDNHYVVVGTHRYATYYYYSAFSERRVFLESWQFATRTYQVGGGDIPEGGPMPFPQRLRLNDAVFQGGDRRALDVLVRSYGVRYLLVDRFNGTASSRVRRLGRQVFSNPAVSIYRVGAG
jgi:hypothetical protein